MPSFSEMIPFLLRRLESGGDVSICLYSTPIPGQDARRVTDHPLAYHENPICREVKKSPERHRQCMAYESAKLFKAFKDGKPFVDVCPFGVIDAVFPIPERNPTFILYVSSTAPSPHKRRFGTELHVVAPGNRQVPARFAREIATLPLIFEAVIERFRDEWAGAPGGNLAAKKTALAKYYVDFHFSQDLSLEKLSARLETHKSALARDYKKTWGHTLHHDLNLRRIRNAKGLLERGISVTSTAHECGYRDANYFSRVFRTHTGQSPKHWQMRHAKDGPRH